MKSVLFSYSRMAMLLVAGAVTLSSCSEDEKKNDPQPQPELTKTEQLTAKPWKMTAATINPALVVGNTSHTDFYAMQNGCQQDNLDKYAAADKNAMQGVYTFDEGAAKCNPNAAQTEDGTWAFNSDKTVITQTRGSSTRQMTIVNLTATTLTVTYPYFANPNQTITATYTAQ